MLRSQATTTAAAAAAAIKHSDNIHHHHRQNHSFVTATNFYKTKKKNLTPVKRKLLFHANTSHEKARRLRWAIGLYFTLCLSLSVLLFTWTFTATLDNDNNSNNNRGWRRRTSSSNAALLRDPFQQVSQGSGGRVVSRSLWTTSENNMIKHPPQQLVVPEELRIPDDEPVVQIINTRYDFFVFYVSFYIHFSLFFVLADTKIVCCVVYVTQIHAESTGTD